MSGQDMLPGLELERRIIGFSGSRLGMSPAQKRRLRQVLIEHRATDLHHGDCLGADEQAHDIARELGLWIVVHPPIGTRLRAYCRADEERAPLSFIARNQMIVRETQFVIAAPAGPEQLHSGTWATIRYCRKRNREHEVLEWAA